MLEIEDEKKEELSSQLTEILEYVENLKELDTTHLDSSFSTLDGGTPMREDIVKWNEEIPKDILAYAPKPKMIFIVPKIIE